MRDSLILKSEGDNFRAIVVRRLPSHAQFVTFLGRTGRANAEQLGHVGLSGLASTRLKANRWRELTTTQRRWSCCCCCSCNCHLCRGRWKGSVDAQLIARRWLEVFERDLVGIACVHDVDTCLTRQLESVNEVLELRDYAWREYSSSSSSSQCFTSFCCSFCTVLVFVSLNNNSKYLYIIKIRLKWNKIK